MVDFKNKLVVISSVPIKPDTIKIVQLTRWYVCNMTGGLCPLRLASIEMNLQVMNESLLSSLHFLSISFLRKARPTVKFALIKFNRMSPRARRKLLYDSEPTEGCKNAVK